jgi:galactonate dehydratase
MYLRWGFKDLLEKQAVDIIMPDLPKCCGLAEGKKIANMAEVYYIPMAPHNVCGPLGTIASCHCCAAVPNFLVLEWHWLERPHWHELVAADPALIQDGYSPSRTSAWAWNWTLPPREIPAAGHSAFFA